MKRIVKYIFFYFRDNRMNIKKNNIDKYYKVCVYGVNIYYSKKVEG